MENSWFLNSCCLFSIPFDTPRGVANAYIWPSDNCHQLRHRSYMQASSAKSPPGVVTCIGPLALGNLFSFASMQLMGLLENLLKQCMGYGYEPINFIHTTLHTWLVFRFCTWPSKAPRLQCISGLADSLTCTASSGIQRWQERRPHCVQGSLMDRISPHAQFCPQASEWVQIMGMASHVNDVSRCQSVPVQHSCSLITLFAEGRTCENQRGCQVWTGEHAWHGGPGKSI